jgi:hypothetical protein
MHAREQRHELLNRLDIQREREQVVAGSANVHETVAVGSSAHAGVTAHRALEDESATAAKLASAQAASVAVAVKAVAVASAAVASAAVASAAVATVQETSRPVLDIPSNAEISTPLPPPRKRAHTFSSMSPPRCAAAVVLTVPRRNSVAVPLQLPVPLLIEEWNTRIRKNSQVTEDVQKQFPVRKHSYSGKENVPQASKTTREEIIAVRKAAQGKSAAKTVSVPHRTNPFTGTEFKRGNSIQVSRLKTRPKMLSMRFVLECECKSPKPQVSTP